MADLASDSSIPSSGLLIDPIVLRGYLRREELAQQFGLSTRTIDRWEALGQGPPRVAVGRTILYSVESVREWLLTRETRPSVRRGLRTSSSSLHVNPIRKKTVGSGKMPR